MSLDEKILKALMRWDETISPDCSLIVDIREIVQDHVEEIATWVDGDEPYHRAKTEFELPGNNAASYGANRDLKWSEPFTASEIANAIREKFIK